MSLYDGQSLYALCGTSDKKRCGIFYLDQSTVPKGMVIPIILSMDNHSAVKGGVSNKPFGETEEFHVSGLFPVSEGVILWADGMPGFWLIPKKDLEDYVTSHKPKS